MTLGSPFRTLVTVEGIPFYYIKHNSVKTLPSEMLRKNSNQLKRTVTPV